MNEEEKKAVEILNTFEFRSKTRNYKKISLEDSKSVKIVLNLLEKLQKENEELKEIYISEKNMKNEYVKLYQDLLLKENVIPVQKVKDEIAELQKMNVDGEVFRTSVNFAIITFQKLLDKGN